MSNQFIEQIRRNAQFELKYNAFGQPINVIILNDNSQTCIPIGNDNFLALIDFINSNGMKSIPVIEWVQIVKNADGRVLHYRCNLGSFVDNDNPITTQIRQRIESETIEIRELDEPAPIVEMEANVFLPNAYTLHNIESNPISSYDFDSETFVLPFPARVSLLQSIESDFFDTQDFIRSHLKNLTGNVIRIRFTGREIRAVFNWSKNQLDSELLSLDESMHSNMSLYKRQPKEGATTNWYLDWLSLQYYIWAPVLEITNRLIDLMNLQAHRKTTPLVSRDDLGDVVCIKTIRSDGSQALWPLSSLRDRLTCPPRMVRR